MNEEKEVEYWKKRYQAAQRELDKMPKGSFVAIQIDNMKRTNWSINTMIVISDKESVRKNNELLKVYNGLNKSFNEDSKVSYIEEGVTKRSR